MALCAVGVGGIGSAANAQVTVEVIDAFPDGFRHFFPSAISADGTTVVGHLTTADINRQSGARWRAGTGFEVIDGLFGRDARTAQATNADGSVVVGFILEPNPVNPGILDFGFQVPYVWTEQDGMSELATPRPGPEVDRGAATGVSADGRVISGTVLFDGGPLAGSAARWVDGVLDVLVAPQPDMHSTSGQLSADGLTMAGRVQSPQDVIQNRISHSFRWTGDGGMIDLGEPPAPGAGGFILSLVSGVSADGGTVFGSVTYILAGSVKNFPARAVGAGPLELIGSALDGGGMGTGNVSGSVADGSVLVGVSQGASGVDEPAFWTEAGGWTSLLSYLNDNGVVAPPGTAQSIVDVSDDGRVMLVSALSPDGRFVFWLVRHSEDQDGDGLPDDWEVRGVPYVGLDGTERRYILPGADPLRKDMYVEVDAAEIEMPANAMDMVVAAFARAPVTNPDQSVGITLHIVIDEQGVPTPGSVSTNGQFPENFATLRNRRFGTVEEQEDTDAPAMLGAKARAFRWCFAYSGIQFPDGKKYFGRGEMPGSSFLIDLDNDIFDVVLHPVGGPRDIASTFMHELGHTLGLHHGGADDIQGKPNYPSIMNYALAHVYPWNRRFWRLDYSHEQLATLDEDALRERDGVNSLRYRRFQMPFGRGPSVARGVGFVKLTGRPTDFNGDGRRTGVVAEDLNFITRVDFAGVGFPSPEDPPLEGHNDWANIIYAPPVGRGGVESDGCMNQDLYDAMSTMIPTPCEPDFDDNGVLNFFDIAAYLNAFNLIDDEADLAEPFGTLDAGDVLEFISQFVEGCP